MAPIGGTSQEAEVLLHRDELDGKEALVEPPSALGPSGNLVNQVLWRNNDLKLCMVV